MENWWAVQDGEYNEAVAHIAGHQVTIFSDRDGRQWHCRVDDGEAFPLESTHRHGAEQEAKEEAEQWP